MRKFILRVFSFLIVFSIIFTSFSFYAFAQTRSVGKIRVGFFPVDGFQEYKNGVYSGYSYDYLQAISQKTGWEYEYVIDSWDNCLKMLKEGKIDILGLARKTEEREKELDFCCIEEGIDYACLLAAKGDTRFAYEDFKSFNGMKVGTLTGSMKNKSLDKYCQDNNFTVEKVQYDTASELVQALNNKSVDSILLTSTMRISGLNEICRFDASKYYFATTKGNSYILDGINSAVKKIKEENPYFDMDLYSTHKQGSSSTSVVFTRDEQDYIKNNPVVKTIYDPDWAPIEYFDKSTGKFKGIVADVFDLISKRTGLKFEFSTAENFSDVSTSFKSGTADVLTSLNYDFNWANENAATLTQPYIEIPVVMVSNGHKNNKKIGLVKQYYLTKKIENFLPDNSQIVYYNTVSDCFEALKSNDVGCIYTNSYVGNYYLSLSKYARFTMSLVSGISENISIAVSKKVEPELLSVLSKSISGIDEENINQIIYNNTVLSKKQNIFDTIYNSPIETITIILIIFVLFVIAFAGIIYMKNKHTREVRKMLLYDALTGYDSYSSFLEKVPKTIESDKSDEFAMIYFDIFRFKYINDTFGYDEGDRILGAISNLLYDFIEKNELFARVYADCFAVLIKYSNRSILENRMIVLMKKLEEIYKRSDKEYTLIFHGGIYLFSHGENDPVVAIDRANYAKETIKGSFKTSYAYYDDKMRNKIAKEKELEKLMKPALENGEFIAYYQPKVDIITDEIIGAEALVRWNRPGIGIVSPFEFIPFFERNSFIMQLDFYIFEEVCRMLNERISAGKKVVPISSNFSRLHISDERFVKKLQLVADKYGIPHNLLEIELTETVAVDNVEVVVEIVKKIRSLNFEVSIDDFGAGYSSIGLLQKMPIDALKLDKDFVHGGMTGKLEQELVTMLVKVTSDNNIRVICEGIETKEQENFIKQINCRLAQGYLYYRPAPRDIFESLLS